MQKICCISQLMVVAQRPPTGWSNKKSAPHDAGCSYISWTEKQTDMGRSYIAPTPCYFSKLLCSFYQVIRLSSHKNVNKNICICICSSAPDAVPPPIFMWPRDWWYKNVSKVTYLCPLGRKTLTQSVNRSGLPTVHGLLWSPYVIGQTIIFLPCDFYLLLLFFLA